MLVIPSYSKLLSTLGVAVIGKNLETRQELLELHLPIEQHACRDYNEMRSPDPTVTGKMS